MSEKNYYTVKLRCKIWFRIVVMITEVRQRLPLEVVHPSPRYELPRAYAQRPWGKFDQHAIVIVDLHRELPQGKLRPLNNHRS